jgi:hypothetical protein
VDVVAKSATSRNREKTMCKASLRVLCDKERDDKSFMGVHCFQNRDVLKNEI